LRILLIEPTNRSIISYLHRGPMLVKVIMTTIAIPLLNCFTDCSKSMCSSGGVCICSIVVELLLESMGNGGVAVLLLVIHVLERSC